MEKIAKFYVTSSAQWFIDLPEWNGDISDLQMVLGGDTLLDLMAQGDQEVTVRFSTEDFPGADVLTWKHDNIENYEESGGATYILKSFRGIEYNLSVWLCDVTKFVFGEMPKEIYFRRLN